MTTKEERVSDIRIRLKSYEYDIILTLLEEHSAMSDAITKSALEALIIKVKDYRKRQCASIKVL